MKFFKWLFGKRPPTFSYCSFTGAVYYDGELVACIYDDGMVSLYGNPPQWFRDKFYATYGDKIAKMKELAEYREFQERQADKDRFKKWEKHEQ